MKMEYRILWIDDNIGSVRGDVRDIRRFLDEKNIDLKLKQIEVTTGTDIVKNQDFMTFFIEGELDFLLVDLNMPEINGIEVISYFRTELRDYFTPIVFYTNDTVKSLPELINKQNENVGIDKYLDGIFFCHRELIGEKLITLMNSKLIRENKIKAVRGMLIENVSDLDIKIIEAIEKTFSLVLPVHKQKVLNKIKERFVRRKCSAEATATDICNFTYEQSIDYILKDLRKSDQHIRADILREILRFIEDSVEYGNVLSSFYNPKGNIPSLNCLRNKYAHQTEVQLQNDHSEENNLFIRAEVKRHKQNMESIISLRDPIE